MNFYDSDLQSQNEYNFQSDNEAPTDKQGDEKLIYKEELKRISKIILKVGIGQSKPAKYDLVEFKILDSNERQQNLDELHKQHILKVNLGGNDYDKWFDQCVENMYKGEICEIKIESLKYDSSSLKVLDHQKLIIIQLIDWTSIIDLFDDGLYMKHSEKKGVGIKRIDFSDEITFFYKILVKGILLLENIFENVSIENLIQACQIDQNVTKIIKRMKNQEQATTKIKDFAFFQNATTLEFKNLQTLISQGSIIDCQIGIQNAIRIDDLFNDKSCLKKVLKNGKGSNKAQRNSYIYFDLEILDDQLKSIYKSQENFTTNLSEDHVKDSNCLKFYLDEYKISKLIRKTINSMKKGEICQVTCNDLSTIQYGLDFNIISQVKTNIVHLIIKLYDFTEGKSTFTMSLEEKIENFNRKKPIALEFIKQQKFKKALKVFENINTYFEIQVEYGQNLSVDQMRITSLLNTTLCLTKLERWKQNIMVCDKILSLDNKNIKAFYRKSFSYLQLLEFSQGLDLLNRLIQDQSLTIEKDKEIFTLVQEFTIKQNEYKNKEKKLYKNMFN